MEEGSRVWLRSPKSEWGWLPAKIVKKEVVPKHRPKAKIAAPPPPRSLSSSSDSSPAVGGGGWGDGVGGDDRPGQGDEEGGGQQQQHQQRSASEEEKKKEEADDAADAEADADADADTNAADDEPDDEPEETTIELTLVDDFDGLLREGNNDGGGNALVGGGKSPGRKGLVSSNNNDNQRGSGICRGDSYYANASSFTEIVRIDSTAGSAARGEEHPDVKLRNTDDGGGQDDDLIGLTHLHEPAILHALRLRYDADVIYTSTGPILLAINPFKVMGGVYGTGLMELYRQGGEEDGMRLVSSPAVSPKNNGGMTSPTWGGGGVTSPKNGGGGDASGDPGGDESFGRKRLPPHVYQAADDAYRAMMRGIDMAAWVKRGGARGRRSSATRSSMSRSSKSGEDTKKALDLDNPNEMPANQSILVSGESGAGKTVTTKIVLNYYAMLSRRSQESAAAAALAGTASPRGRAAAPWIAADDCGGGGGGESIEHQVLQSNPILEAFGNARTIRNDNSSRFGKYINIAFTETGRLVRASVDTYLLEKVRLLHQAPGERNFHVFYQFLEAATDDEREELMLSGYTYRDFNLMNQSSTYDRRDGVSDADMHFEMVEAMGVMHFGSETVRMLMRLVVAVLFAGNMTFSMRRTATYGDAAVLDETEASTAVARLLGVSFDNLASSLTSKVIFARGDVIEKGLDAGQAAKASEALIKSIYGAGFDFIAERINASINFGSGGTGGGAPGLHRGQSLDASAPINIIPQGGASIGVLDIFGFETIESNSFEQFCINYTNETLQQQFNKFVFKLEQQGTFSSAREPIGTFTPGPDGCLLT
jgi:hypothetical protein